MAATVALALKALELEMPASWKKGVTKSPHGMFPCKGNRKGYWGFIAVAGEKDTHVWSGNRGGITIKEGQLVLTTRRNAFFPWHNVLGPDVTIYHLVAKGEDGKNEAIPWITEEDLLDYLKRFLDGEVPLYRIVTFSDARKKTVKSSVVYLGKPNFKSERKLKLEVQEWDAKHQAWIRMPVSPEAKLAALESAIARDPSATLVVHM